MRLRRENRLEALRRSAAGGAIGACLLTLPVLALSVLALSVLMAALVGGPAPVFAQSSTDIDAIRARQDAKRRLLDDKQRLQSILKADLDRISRDRERLKQRLVQTAGAIQASEAKMSASETRIDELDAQIKIRRGSLDQNRDIIAKLLGAMQRMGRNPPPVMITRRADALQMVRSAQLLAATFPHLKGEAVRLAGELNELVRDINERRAEAEKLNRETARLNDRRTSLSALLEERRRSFNRRQSELAALRREAGQIKKSVTDLGELITRFDRAVAKSTSLGAYNEQTAKARNKDTQVAALALAPAPPLTTARKVTIQPIIPGRPVAIPAPAPPDPPPSIKPPKQRVAVIRPPPPPNPPQTPDSVVIAPRAQPALLSPGRLQPAVPFSRSKGKLPMPAKGRQVVSFGEKTQYGARSKGIVIETRYNAQITSPADGWIVYAGEFRSYGQLLIINAGGGYHVLLAGLSRIDAQLGQFVLAGEPVGVMAAAARKSKAKTQDNAPVLYVEFRKQGRPINPGPWWSKGL